MKKPGIDPGLFHFEKTFEAGSGSARTAKPFFLKTHEPEIDLVNPGNIFFQYGLVSILADDAFIVAALEIGDDLEQLIHLGMHDAQVGDQPDLINIKRTTISMMFDRPLVHEMLPRNSSGRDFPVIPFGKSDAVQ
jgi:hypothetical protein